MVSLAVVFAEWSSEATLLMHTFDRSLRRIKGWSEMLVMAE